MSERRVIVDGAATPGDGDLEIRINGADPTFRFHYGRSSDRNLDWLEPRTRDLALIAAAVFAADSSTSRGSTKRSRLGSQWYRSFHFVVPVEDLAFWTSGPAKEALVDALSFLTGDSFAFTFVRTRWRRPRSLIDGIPHSMKRRDEVILFSGGLDSLTGALETLNSGDASVVLVTHRSAPKQIALQNDLIDELRVRFSGRIHWFPVRATRVHEEADETTQRSRSFLFATLGYIAARVVGATRVRFFENGIVSVNLPINRQVVGTMATRTTHPLALRRLETLLSRVAEEPMSIDNPYLSLTKTEVVARLASQDGARLAARTMSCSNVRERTIQHTHCGACSQCIDRRFAMLAADLSPYDPAEKYEIDVIAGQRDKERDRSMALDWARHAMGLGRLEPHSFVARYAAEVSDVLEAFPERRPGDVQADLFALHRRHGATVLRVLGEALRSHSSAVVEGTLAEGSLLRMAGAGLAAPDIRSHVGSPSDADPPSHVEEPIFPLRVSLTSGAGPQAAIVHGLGRIAGAPVNLISTLRPAHEKDCAACRAADDHGYVSAGEVAQINDWNKPTVRQLASRCRKQLAELYEAVEGSPPDRHLLIENRPNRGYRLDPLSRFVPTAGG